MSENEMEYRGSKSNKDDTTLFVKEQRVDGSCIGSSTLGFTSVEEWQLIPRNQLYKGY